MANRSLRPAIIIVDDAADIRRLVQRLLHDLTRDFDLIAVDSAAKALEQLERRTVPLLITEYAMPGMNGLDLIRLVKLTAPATTIIMISAYASAELHARALSAGADHFLAKPFPLSQLAEPALRALRGWQSHHHPEDADS